MLPCALFVIGLILLFCVYECGLCCLMFWGFACLLVDLPFYLVFVVLVVALFA